MSLLLSNKRRRQSQSTTGNPALGTINFSDLNLPVFQQIFPLETINFSDLNFTVFR